jgi:hypothetical protein
VFSAWWKLLSFILPTAQSPLSTWLQANDLIGLAPSVLVAHEAITIHYLFLPWNPFPDDNHRTRDERHVGWSSIRMPTYPRKYSEQTSFVPSLKFLHTESKLWEVPLGADYRYVIRPNNAILSSGLPSLLQFFQWPKVLTVAIV